MKVDSILRAKGHEVVTIQPWATVEAALERLIGPPRIGALVVTGVPRGFPGVLVARDIIKGLRTHGSALLEQRVSDLMSRHVPTCSPDDSVSSIMVRMTQSRFRHLPVLRHGELVGLISIGDVVRNRLDEMELETNVLRDLYAARH